jgi:hypothetical protein
MQNLRLYLFFCGFVCCGSASAQLNQLLPPDHQTQIEFMLNNAQVHTAIRPFRDNQLNGLTYQKDSATDVKLFIPSATMSNTYRMQSDSAMLSAQKSNSVDLRPLLDLSGGYDIAGKKPLWSAVGGIDVRMNFKTKLGVEFRALGGSSTLPAFLDSVALQTKLSPSFGDRAYGGNEVWKWQHASGYVSWSPRKIFNLQAGRDKHFWGDGYRSMFLSDFAAPYLYIKQSTTIWHLQYTSMVANFKDYTLSSQFSSQFRNKYGSFHYIDWNATKWLNIGVFEAVMWQGSDNNRYRGLDPNYLNPLIFFRPVEYSLGSSDNAFLGFATRIRLNKNNQLYGQLMLDEFFLKEIRARRGWWANKQGGQFGWKSFNLFHIPNLNLQAELNIARPYMYAHSSAQQNYAHAGRALAHPLGGNFMEAVGILSWQSSKIFLRGKITAAQLGLDTAGINYGGNIFQSYIIRPQEYNNSIGQGLTTNLVTAEFSVTTRPFKHLPFLRVELQAGARYLKNELYSRKDAYVSLGIRSSLWNVYRDF